MVINGEVVSHTLCEFSASIPGKGVKKFLGLESANYSDELEQVLEYGTGAVPIGVSIKQYKPAADVSLLKNEGQRFLDLVGDGYGLVTVSFMFVYRQLTGDKRLFVDRIPAARIVKPEDSTQRGGEGNLLKLTLLPTEVISRSGVRIIIPPNVRR